MQCITIDFCGTSQVETFSDDFLLLTLASWVISDKLLEDHSIGISLKPYLNILRKGIDQPCGKPFSGPGRLLQKIYLDVY